MKSVELRQKFLDFFQNHEHKIVPSSSLLPNDSSVLFTTAGMQQFKSYYLGEKSPWGVNVASCQKCIRTSDIEEVGDERHLTFFEMLGNFSFGGYWKEQAIELAYKFIVEELKLTIDYVTVFSPEKVEGGDWRKSVIEDTESYEIWRKYVSENKIRKEGSDNFWGPTGEEGPCGPTTEIYINGIEIWNIVFNEFFCTKEKKLEKLNTPGVDTGMGLERLAMVTQKVSTVFETDLFSSEETKEDRIIADHIKASIFMIADGMRPSNKEAGYILRRLMRIVVSYEGVNIEKNIDIVIDKYRKIYPNLDKDKTMFEFDKEKEAYQASRTATDKVLGKRETIGPLTGYEAFGISSTLGVQASDIIKIAEDINIKIVDNFDKQFKEASKKHQELSRTASAGMFKGGLADHDQKTIQLHTAHHLLLAALQELFGKQVKQRGSNINQERLRIDFSFDRKLTDEEKKKLEDMVNNNINQGLEVVKRDMPKEEAEKIGAEMEFGVKYGNTVSVYFIEDKKGNVFSKEFCGGPHVGNTSELGKFKIIKEEAVSTGVRRIKAILE